MIKKRLAIITSHPIQYNAPLFRLLTERGKLDIKVFYTWGQTEKGEVYDPDFQKSFKWDIPLLDGYAKEFVENISKKPTAGHFSGIDNRDLIERINKYEPDTLLVLGWSFKSHLRVLRYYHKRKKILFWGDSNLLDEKPGYSIKKFVRRVFLFWLYRHVDVALYTGIANKAYYLKHGIDEGKLVYAPHAIESERFEDTEGNYHAAAIKWRRELGILDEEKVFLFCGKLEAKKDPLILLSAFRQLNDSSIRLLFVGNGYLESKLKELSRSDRRVLFLDFQNQGIMPVVYRLGDIFVLPSYGPGETWGLSINEALACNRPVIVSTKCGGAPDLVDGRGVGLVFEAGNANALKDAMQTLLRQHELLNVKPAVSKILTIFSFNTIAEAIEKSA